MFAGKKSAQIREILISESAWEEMTCLFAPSLVHFHNEKIEEARICIDKSLQLEPRRRKAVVIKECVDMYVPNPLKNNIKLYYKETESESHRVIIDNILKLKQLTRICMR
ncbi:hypothetical protein CA899_004525 [Escherichia coli]|nr:hypothetical protein CA899_004525 [Escherichia coli]